MANTQPSPSDATAIVLGATGLVGKALVQQLANAAHVQRVIAITRRPVAYADARIHNRVVDFDNLAAHSDAFHGRWLFSALGTTRKQAGTIAAQRVVDVDYQLQAAKLAAGNGVYHYLLVSSTGANPRSRSAYTKMKGELEQAVQQLGFPRVSIFRPGVLEGTRDASRPGESALAGLLRVAANLPGLSAVRPIPGSDVAKRMVQVSVRSGRGTEVFGPAQVFPSQDQAL